MFEIIDWRDRPVRADADVVLAADVQGVLQVAHDILGARLAGLRGSGVGFSSTTAAVYAAVRSVPGAEIETIAFDQNGELRATVSAENEWRITDLQTRIEAYGFAVQHGQLVASAGRSTTVLTVTPR